MGAVVSVLRPAGTSKSVGAAKVVVAGSARYVGEAAEEHTSLSCHDFGGLQGILQAVA